MQILFKRRVKMTWQDSKPNGFGGFAKKRNDRNQNESLHGRNVDKKDRIVGDHVHYHKDGATVTKDSKKYTLRKEYCPYCKKDTRHRWETSSEMKCLTCNSWHS